MVAFAMSEKDSAAILKDVLEKNPPPCGYFPYLFSCFCELRGITQEPAEIERFAALCGIGVLVVKMPASEAA